MRRIGEIFFAEKRILIFFFFLLLIISNGYSQKWVELGQNENSLNANHVINTLCKDIYGNIYAAGRFTNKIGNFYVAKWDGVKWIELDKLDSTIGKFGEIISICPDTKGNIYAVGNFRNSMGNPYVSKWDGRQWKELALNNVTTYLNLNIGSICSDPIGNIYAAGYFGKSDYKTLIMWDGNKWNSLGNDSDINKPKGFGQSVCSDHLGNIYVAIYDTSFTNRNYVAKWDGSKWGKLKGDSLLGAFRFLYTICSDGDGNIYTSGVFNNKDNNMYAAKWDGKKWTELKNDSSQLYYIYSINSLCSDKTGSLYAGGQLYRYNSHGTGAYVLKRKDNSWSQLERIPSVFNAGNAYSIISDEIGNLYAAGNSLNNSKNWYVAKWCIDTCELQTKHINEFRIFPNPTSDFLIMQTPKEYANNAYTIYSFSGKLLEQGIINSEEIKINVRNYSQGVYMILLQNGKRQMFEIIKMN
ncbi:MAG: T9SS type A sorting domain-containing protein [Bacteroidetes bacterium]|nr:T9SS type A sorting domain-containing protein [Bacteroidota bacterium]